MPTKFEEIYGRALFKFTDYSFLNPCCTDMKEAVLQKYLLSSIVDFQHSCKENLNDYDLEKEQFNVELDAIKSATLMSVTSLELSCALLKL